ncbi:hypothetical protein, conserved [Leishmania tarentolae]|uniref:Uncharacterized protein n=1 Tax=Leishmania tarentolae TaxID=5689 RepID=A0A640KKI5_LEITA|nr:hypothetical protein, conserved [Leishmania tarentolae]
MWPSSTRTPASGTGSGLAHAEGVDGSTRLPRPTTAAASASLQTMTSWSLSSLPLHGSGHLFRTSRAESPMTIVAASTEQRTLPHDMMPIRLTRCSRTWPPSVPLPLFPLPCVSAAPSSSLHSLLSKALLYSLLTSSAAATPMLTSTGARRRSIRVPVSRQQHALAQGITVLYQSHNRQIRRLLAAAVSSNAGGRPSVPRLGVAVRALATATPTSTSADTNRPLVSPESFLDLNEVAVHPVLSNSNAVSSTDSDASAKRETSRRFTAKQCPRQQLRQEQPPRLRNRPIKERRSGSQGSLHQREHGARTSKGRTPRGQLSAQQQPSPSPHKKRHHVHSSGHHGGPTSSTAPNLAGSASAHARRGSSTVRRSAAVTSSAIYVRTAEGEEEVGTTWSGPAGRRGGDYRKQDDQSEVNTSATDQASWSASCDPDTAPKPAQPSSTAYTNTGAPNCAALRRLIKSHNTFLKNYEVLQKSDKVVAALERWCAEAVAHSRFVEHLALALCGDSHEGTMAHLLLTGASDRGAAAGAGGAAAPTSANTPSAETLAVLEVPLSVVNWLNEPIVMPVLDAGTLVASVDKMLASSHMDKAPASGSEDTGAGELFAVSAEDSPATLYEYNSLEAMGVWYDAWGRQQHCREATTSLPSSNTELATSSLKASIALWNRRQCVVQDVLLSHLTEGARPSVLDELPFCSAAGDGRDTHHASPVECGSEAAVSTSGIPVQPVGHAETRPDQFVEEVTQELLPSLIEFLQTLSAFKAAREEAKVHAQYHALLDHAVSVQSGSAQTATAAQGTYTHLCLVARRFHASPPVELDLRPAASGIPYNKPLSEDCGVGGELCTAAKEYLRSTSKVDKVAPHPQPLSSPLEGSTGDSGAHATTGAPSSLPLAEPPEATPCYSVAVLDICISVVLRCLLFYLPVLSAKDRCRVLQQLSAPWLTHEPDESARVACWSTFFGVAEFLSKACASKRQKPIAAWPSAMGGRRGGDSLISHAFHTTDHCIVSTLQGVVKQLRSLCWPTVRDRHSGIVQHTLCLLPMVSEAPPSPASSATPVSAQPLSQRRPPTEARPGDTAPSTAAASTVAAAPAHSTRPRAPAWRDVVAVVQGSESRQRLGYELLFFFLGALRHANALSFAAPVNTTGAAAAADVDASVAKPALPHHWSSSRRRLNTVCIYALDVDSFIAERMGGLCPAGDLWPLLRLQPSSTAGSEASQPRLRPSLMELLAEQTAHPYGLSRVALCTFSDSLLGSWSTLSPQRVQILMVALQRAVAAPAALTLRSLLHSHGGTRAGWQISGTGSFATPSHAMQLAARRPEWRAVAPLMSLYTARACPSLWGTMWAYLSSEMKSLPRQVKEIRRTAHASSGDARGGHVARGEQCRATEGVELCYKQLEELATMCAWLIVMVPSVCGKRLAGAGASTSDPAEMSALEHTERVKVGFEDCVQGLLAVWTQTGASANAAEQLLNLIYKHPSATPTPVDCTPVREAHDGAVIDTAQGAKVPPAPEETEADEAVTLLMELVGAARTHVWTGALYGAVELWIKKTRYIQAQSRGIMEAVQLMPFTKASDSAPAAMTAAAPGGTAEGDFRTGETVSKNGSDTSVLTALSGVDSVLLAWWRSTEEEDIGLPSARVYLTQVYKELLRIVSARAGLAPPALLPERAHIGHPINSERDAVSGGATTGTGAVESGSEPRPSVRDDTPVGGAAVKTVFSASEVFVIVRVLSSIAARGATTVTLGRLTERASGRAGLDKASSAGHAENTAGIEATFRSGDSIMDSLHRAAVYATAAGKGMPSTTTPDATPLKGTSPQGLSTATEGDESRNPARVDLVEETTAHDRDNAAAVSPQHAVRRIEEALLSSLTAHSGVLPATTVVEATWLRLLPLSTLQKLLDRSESSPTITAAHAASPLDLLPSAPPCKVSNSQSLSGKPAVRADPATTAETPPSSRFVSPDVVASSSASYLDGSLRESSSPWLHKLHDAVLTSRHSCHASICLVASLYSFLEASPKGDSSNQFLAAATRCDGSRGGASAATVSCIEDCDAARDVPSLATSRLRLFLARLRTSCAEAVVLLHKARRAHTDATAAFGGGNIRGVGGAGEDGAQLSLVGVTKSPWAGAAEVGGDGSTGAETTVSHMATPHQQHGQRFCNVLAVTSELHERLEVYAEELTCAAAGCGEGERGTEKDMSPTSRNRKSERMRHLLRLLYSSLLDAVADFVPYGMHGNAVEVMQMQGVVTRRMPWQQCAQQSLVRALPLEENERVDNFSSDETVVEAVPLVKRRGGAAEADAAARWSGTRDSDEGAFLDPLLVRFREQVIRLMPYVDAEALRCTKSRSPQLLRLALIGSAKSSVEYVLRSVLVSSRGLVQRQEGPCAVAPEVARSRSAVALPPVPRSAAKMSASESASHGISTETEPARLGLSTLPIWSQAPLESLLQRVAMDRLMASRHALYLCTLIANAPEFSTVLLPLTHYLRDARARLSWAMLDVVFKALAVSAVNFQRHNQAEMLLRSNHLLPLSSSSPASDQALNGASSFPAACASSTSAAERPRRGEGGSDASLRVGEMTYPHSNRSAGLAPLFRTAAVPSVMFNAPSQLRHTWGDLARRLLHEEDDAAVSDCSLWVLALYCGAVVNCTGTQVFNQLLACLVFGTTATTASMATTTTRIARLDVLGWTLVLGACGMAVDHHDRHAYQDLLRDEFVAFLERTTASAPSESGVSESSASFSSYSTAPTAVTAESGRVVLDDALPLEGAWRCGLLEAIPQLFVEDAVFWRRVKSSVESWCSRIVVDPAEVSGKSPSAQRRPMSAARRAWVTQLQQSFNWAVRCAGHSSLVFSDTWATEAAHAEAHAVTEWMRMQLEALGTSAPPVINTPQAPPHVPQPRGKENRVAP